MDTRTGDIYESEEAARKAGVPKDRLVTGTKKAIEHLSEQVRRNRAKAARRKARGK